jgi:hypothetical protein
VIEPANSVFNSDLLVEGNQIGAKLEEHMLAVVHDFARRRMFVGRGASAEKRAAFEESDAESTFRQRTRGRETGETATDNSD